MENVKVKEAKLIFNMGVGRALLKAGAQVIDVKPDRTNPDKTVLVFRNDEVFQRELARINKPANNKSQAAQELDGFYELAATWAESEGDCSKST